MTNYDQDTALTLESIFSLVAYPHVIYKLRLTAATHYSSFIHARRSILRTFIMFSTAFAEHRCAYLAWESLSGSKWTLI